MDLEMVVSISQLLIQHGPNGALRKTGDLDLNKYPILPSVPCSGEWANRVATTGGRFPGSTLTKSFASFGCECPYQFGGLPLPVDDAKDRQVFFFVTYENTTQAYFID